MKFPSREIKTDLSPLVLKTMMIAKKCAQHGLHGFSYEVSGEEDNPTLKIILVEDGETDFVSINPNKVTASTITAVETILSEMEVKIAVRECLNVRISMGVSRLSYIDQVVALTQAGFPEHIILAALKAARISSDHPCVTYL